MRKPIVMMSDASQAWETTSDPVRADSWFNNTDGLHTVQVSYSNLVGAFNLQGTLAMKPTEEDWFNIYLTGCGCDESGPYIKYPRNPAAPTGINGGDTGTDAFTFTGNFTFLRARLLRDHLGNPPSPNDMLTLLDKKVGTITSVILSL